MAEVNAEIAEAQQRLIAEVGGYGRCAVAFSAGVDSAVVAKAAQMALGEGAVAVTAQSPSLAVGELEEAKRVAEQIGIRHVIVETEEFSQPDYLKNAPDRCYHCKTELYATLGGMFSELGVDVIANGANLDDAGDYRPGMTAAEEHRVKSPLLDCGFGKSMVRSLAASWELPVWDKPAMPCLSSRIAYGEEVTPERVAMVDQAEQYLRALGLTELRVRYHRGDMARIEVPATAISRLANDSTRDGLVRRLREIGFQYVTLDLEGFRSGSMNQVLPVESLTVVDRD